MKDPLVVSAMRSPIAKDEKDGGAYSLLTPQDLSLQVLEGLFRTVPNIKPEHVDVFKIGSAISLKTPDQAPAKGIAIRAGMINAASDLVEKACSSALLAEIQAAQAIKHEGAHIVVAGGVDDMNRDKDASKRALTCPITKKMMFKLADEAAVELGLSREEHDTYARESYRRAKAHLYSYGFVMPILIPGQERFLLNYDQNVLEQDDPDFERKMTRLLPGCKIITPLSSSKYGSGAAFTVLADKKTAEKFGWRAMAKLLAFAESSGGTPQNFVREPARAMKKLLKKTKLCINDIDLFLVNAAFATSPLDFMRETKAPHEIVNPEGDSIALGHPLGMTGARLFNEAVYLLRKYKKRRAAVVICNAVYEAKALMLEIC